MWLFRCGDRYVGVRDNLDGFAYTDYGTYGDGCASSRPALDGNWQVTAKVMGRQVAIDLVKTYWRNLEEPN